MTTTRAYRGFSLKLNAQQGEPILVAAGGLLAATFLATPHNRARVRKWLEQASTALKVRLAQLRSS